MSGFFRKVWKDATLEAVNSCITTRLVDYQWECDPHPPTAVLPSIPSPCREAAVSALRPSGQLLTWCTESRTSTDESLIPGSNCRADTLFPECQRGPGGDRHGV